MRDAVSTAIFIKLMPELRPPVRPDHSRQPEEEESRVEAGDDVGRVKAVEAGHEGEPGELIN